MNAIRKWTVAVLEGMIELLSDKNLWTRGAMARTLKGNPIGPYEPNAVRWCQAGARYMLCETAAPRDMRLTVSMRVKQLIENEAASRDPVYVNDNLGYDATMVMLRKALDKARRIKS